MRLKVIGAAVRHPQKLPMPWFGKNPRQRPIYMVPISRIGDRGPIASRQRCNLNAMDDGALRTSNDAAVSFVPPLSRVGDWRAGLGRSLCSLLPHPFGCEVSQQLR